MTNPDLCAQFTVQVALLMPCQLPLNPMDRAIAWMVAW